MRDEKLSTVLVDVGLSDNQAKVYLASLALGTATATAIAKEAGLKRTTVYPVIESLSEFGLITEDAREYKRRYTAESPDKLDALVDLRRERLKRSLGSLHALYDLRQGQSAIKFYEGVSSIKTVYNGLLEDVEPGDDYLIISSPDEWFSLDPDFFQDFIQRRAKLDLKIRSLLLDSKIGRDYLDKASNYNLQAKILPPNTSFTANIVIIPRKLVVHQLVPPIWAIVIENQSIVRTHQEMFEIMWRATP